MGKADALHLIYAQLAQLVTPLRAKIESHDYKVRTTLGLSGSLLITSGLVGRGTTMLKGHLPRVTKYTSIRRICIVSR